MKFICGLKLVDMHFKNILAGAVVLTVLLSSCVSKKVLKSEKVRYETLQTAYNELQARLKDCNDLTAAGRAQKAALEAELAQLKKENAFLKDNNNQALKQLEQLSVISSSQAESIKKSLENIGAKDNYIQSLQSELSRKDSLNMALVMNLKGAIGNIDDKDINIKVDKGVVYIDISDKMLFTSGSYQITPRAKEVLGKVALVLKNQPNIEFMVEGHTDNVPYKAGAGLIDNWDLSVKRATTVVRTLQNDYGLNPAKMAAAGRSEYNPIADNASAEGRSANRRTRIVILPQLDQFFQLLEKK